MTEAVPTAPRPEDLKIITLARAALARVAADEGAAARDEIGRTDERTPEVCLDRRTLPSRRQGWVRDLRSDAVVVHGAPDVSVLAIVRRP